ncbi:FAD/NAD(P)-binding oxidoreductase [Burkholderia sp. WAC0059]|uniref:FAD/NAD(P)-dependent oxidoreductase n=1 Tax=Burkholderia sp. WAC0059 TaxID=2066022 RepID=UPI000C7F2E39|nr:NAD(P)/FAD-dependent oxidoreductase [Burkholderia sp. WAC0059]PLZ02050.1 FAD/NAD(P)-binding oxidoreductase [Burkholderia sp. WAC0059]
MPVETVDVAVVGAGPAGLAAATLAAQQGASVVLLDEQASPGGQIYRAITKATARRIETLGPDYAAGAGLVRAFVASNARHEGEAAVWQVTRERTVHYLQNGVAKTLQAKRLILCTGALERPFPVPGWTLPGVLGAGAAQILLKSADTVPAVPVVLAGSGPLLYLLGWQYLRAGVKIRAVVDTSGSDDYRRAFGELGSALAGWRALAKGVKYLRALRRAGVPFHTGARALAIEGDTAARALTFDAQGKRQRIDASLILLHQGVVPHTQFTWSLRASHRWDKAQLCWAPQTDAWGELDAPGVFVAGDARGIGGALAAAEQGRLAALGALCGIGRIDAAQRDALAAAPQRALRETLRIRPFLDALYRPKDEHRIPADDVVVCRCEEVTAGEIRRCVQLGAPGPNQAKVFSRCGMGPCQGRQCGLTVTELMAAELKVSPAQVGYYRIRPPLKPITLGELASAAEPDLAAPPNGH